jgi:type VI secretion system FHA domain protein
MIVLSVSSYNGAPTEPREASFDELGGTIGRATTNQLVLPDPDRTISRVHAQVVLRNGNFAVVDRGSNAISVNGVPLGNGREAPLKPGDTLNVGGYVIQVRAGHQTIAKDPFGDLFGSPSTRPSAPPPPAAAPAFFAPPPPAPATPMGAIPADWDPFAPEMPTSGVAITRIITTPSDPLGLGAPDQAPLSAGPSLDDLFGLEPMGAVPTDPLGVLGTTPPPNTSGDADPLRALLQPAGAPQPVLPADTVSDLHLPWQAALTAPSVTAPASPAGAVLSWDDSMRDNKVITLPDVRHLDGGNNAPPPARPVPVASAATAPVGDTTALLNALLAGLGLQTSPIQALTPATMQLIGELLRESTRGAVELLRARAALKQEVRAQVTMIVTQGNNPLKFSPNVDAALTHLLGPVATGFMPPARAMRDAFDDLRAHEIGVMAGMRAALDGVLARFDPAALDSAITKRGALASLLPGSRKAQLWEQFQQLYTQLSREAADDFHTLFGKAFLQAYEAQLTALEAEPGPGSPARR